ncbi:MAG: type IV pilus twitching motility protein PilT [bacterium]
MLNIEDLLKIAVERHASDLHITVGRPPVLRISGELVDLEFDPLDAESAKFLIYSLLTRQQRDVFEDDFELDFAYEHTKTGRFRVNLYKQKGYVGAALRVIPSEIPSIEKLELPPIISELAELPSGLVIIAGPSGCGKSTTLACMIDIINTNRKCHIVTIEDPIEFLHRHKNSIVTQREVGNDTKSFSEALKHVLRQNPDVILVGEIRDTESMEMAITAAETGHLVLTTLHTQDAAQTVDRIVDLFNPHQQQQIRTQLSGSLRAVIAQQLLPKADGSCLIPALEILITTSGVKNLIRKGETYQLYSIMQTGKLNGMQTMNQCLRDLVINNKITKNIAMAHSPNVDELKQMLG